MEYGATPASVLRAFCVGFVCSSILGAAAPQEETAKPASRPAKLRVLVLGGTGFLGPKIVERAVANGHEVVLFNRGKTNPGLFPDLEKLRGDRRAGDYESLKGDRVFDAVVDTSAYFPRQVREAAAALGDRCKHYVVVSSISVYPRVDSEDVDETSAVGTIEDETTEKVTGASYGPLKALCEKAAETAYPGRATAVRPGLIVGDGDDTNRFAYWPLRLARGGEVLAPLGPDQTIQIIDVEDLGAWIVRVVEERTFGVYNAVSRPIRFETLFDACRKVSKSESTITYVDRAFLEERKIAPWGDLPAWFPPPEGADKGPKTDVSKAIAKGLTFRPLEETVKAVLTYEKSRPADRPAKFSFTAEREAEALAEWKKRATKK